MTVRNQDELKVAYGKQLSEHVLLHSIHKFNCHHCGKEAYAEYPHAKYCSYRCTNDAYIKRRKERRQEARKKNCMMCGRRFEAKRNDAKYCSLACKQSSYRRRVTDTRQGDVTTTFKHNVTNIG